MTDPTPPVTDPREPTPLGVLLEERALAARDRARASGHPSREGYLDPAEAIRRREADRQAVADAARLHGRIADQLAAVPRRYVGATVTDPRVRAWVEHTAHGGTDSVVILGNVGSGKTHEAFAAWQQLVRTEAFGDRARFASVPAMLEGMRPGRGGTAEAELTEAPLLLLDDLAAERGSDWTVEILYRILDARYAWMRPTIVTSNVDPAKVRELLGDRIASRLNGLGERIVLDHPDRRTGADRRRA